MQHIKNSKKNSEIELVSENSETLTNSLAYVMDKFNLKKHFSIFNFIKSKGLAVSSILNILIILPFLGFASIHALAKTGLSQVDFEGEKDTIYDIKNNSLINWRHLLTLHIKRFMYLVKHNINLKSDSPTAFIFDDTILEKTGKKIEKVGYVHNHTSTGNVYILGFKLLVLGFWDGKNFIPIDFSLHREKGNTKKREKLIKSVKRTKAIIKKQDGKLLKSQEKLNKKCEINNVKKLVYKAKSTITKKKTYEKSKKAYNSAKQEVKLAEKLLSTNHIELDKADKKLKRFYNNNNLYGLSKKEREQQFKADVETGTHGDIRRKETDIDKISIMLKMLSRAVKNGIIPNYVLVDSWFFCFALLLKLNILKKGAIKLIAMVKINNQGFELSYNNKKMSLKNILATNKNKVKRSRKLKSKYIKVPCTYTQNK